MTTIFHLSSYATILITTRYQLVKPNRIQALFSITLYIFISHEKPSKLAVETRIVSS